MLGMETAMVLFMETVQRPLVQRHPKLWVQGHPKDPGCSDTPKTHLDTPNAVGAGMPQRPQGKGSSKGPGCRDVSPDHHSTPGAGSPDPLPLWGAAGATEPLSPPFPCGMSPCPPATWGCVPPHCSQWGYVCCKAALQPQEEALAQPSSSWMKATDSPREQWGEILARSCSVLENRTVPQFPHSPTKLLSAFSAKQGGNCSLEPNITVTGPNLPPPPPKHSDAGVLGDTG